MTWRLKRAPSGWGHAAPTVTPHLSGGGQGEEGDRFSFHLSMVTCQSDHENELTVSSTPDLQAVPMTLCCGITAEIQHTLCVFQDEHEE